MHLLVRIFLEQCHAFLFCICDGKTLEEFSNCEGHFLSIAEPTKFPCAKGFNVKVVLRPIFQR
jgi:hypothetical protein